MQKRFCFVVTTRLDFSYCTKLTDAAVQAVAGAFQQAEAFQDLDRLTGKISNFLQILQIFGGLVLGCIKTKFCK